MYGQANYGPPFGPGSQPPRATYQQHPPGPPPQPPNPHFQQRPQAPSQQVPPGVPPHMGQAGPPLYQHGLPSLFPRVQAPLRTPNAGESYRHLPPTVSQSYPGGQQPQHSSHFRAPNANHNLTIAPPSHGPHRPEMVRSPHPLGALPPPPRIQGQMPHTTVFYPLPPYSGGLEGVKQNPPLPPPPPPTTSSGFSGPIAYACSDSHASAAAPPLPPRLVETESLKALPLLEPIEAKTVQGIEDLCTSTADSDMEMEDDITLIDKDQKMDYSSEGLLNAEEIGAEELSNAPRISRENILLPDTPSEFLSPHQQSEDLTLKLDVKVNSQVVHKVDAADCLSNDNLGKTMSLTADKLSPLSTSSAAETTTSKNHSKTTEAGNPIRLLQDYASDENSESDDEILYKDINPSNSKLLTSLAGISTPNKDTSSCLETETRSKIWLSKSSTNHNAVGTSPTASGEVKDAGVASINTRIADWCQENNYGNKKAVKDFRNKSSLDDGDAHDISKTEEQQVKYVSASLKVDEFGRLVREGSIDSDSDRGYANRRERRAKRDRSRSRSRSPLDRRRTKRSSRRRKDRQSRSHSRSWSPRNRRSRSRSPSYRRAGEFSGVKNRSNRGRGAECFDFIRGKCYRGASCRYMHHEVGKSDSSRRYKGKQKNPENNNTKKDTQNISLKHPDYVCDKTQIQELQDSRVDWKRKEINMDSRQANSSDHIGELIESGMVNCPSPREVRDTVWEMKITLQKSVEPNLQIHDYRTFSENFHEPASIDNFPSQSVNSNDILNSQGDTSLIKHPLMKNSGIHKHESNTSVAEDQNADCMSCQRDGYSVSDELPNQTTINSSENLSDRVPVQNIIVPTGSLPNACSSQSLPSEAVTMQYSAGKELSPTPYTAPSIPHESSQLPPPPHFPPPYGANAPHRPHLPLGYSSTPLVAPVPVQSSHAMNSHTYQASVANQHPQFCVPPNSSWSLPPPPSRPPLELRFGAETATPSVSSQFQQSHFPPRNESHTGSQVTFGFLHHSHPSIQEQNNLTSLGLGSLHQQPVTSQELYANRTLHDNLPPGQLSQSSSEIHPFSHMQVATGHLKYHVGDGNVGLTGKIGYTSQYLPNDQDKNQSSLGPDFGLPRIVAHHNPYASTFEQPLGSKLTLASLSQDKVSANQKHVAIDGQGVGSFGYRQTTSSPSSARADGKTMTSAGGDQYDPLFDSMETSSARKKDLRARKWEPASDSDRMEKSSGAHMPVDLDENSRHDVAAVASMASLDNDDFGETADAEVGAVENDSPIDPVGAVSAEEREADTKSTGKKKKKKKDSRSTKPFKMAIADFVKDVLKPSWRQGNMSKEAFKTIVKKTVDKVSGAMKGHNVPKSQAKIDQYIDSSQRKLTKLVMGYVDKYVKV